MRVMKKMLRVLIAAAFVGLGGFSQSVLAESAKMTIATGVDPGFSHFYVVTLAEVGKKFGLDLQLKTGPSGGASVPLVISNQSNASMSAVLAGINNHLVDKNVVAVAQVVTYDKYFGVVSLKSIKSIDQLKGKKIGITKGTASETLWAEILKHDKLDAKEFAGGVVNVEAPEMLAALERGDIQAFSGWEPWLSRTVLALDKTHILRTNEGVLLDLGFIYMNRGWIEKNRDAAVRFMKAMVATTEFIKNKPDETKKIVGKLLNLSPALMDQLMSKLTFYLKLDQQSYDLTKVHIEQLVQKGRLKPGEFDYGKWFYADLLKAAAPERVALPPNM
jgi:ABC-type nitrate/sulfonate/bicarbonate transport system substrate-binding protein